MPATRSVQFPEAIHCLHRDSLHVGSATWEIEMGWEDLVSGRGWQRGWRVRKGCCRRRKGKLTRTDQPSFIIMPPCSSSNKIITACSCVGSATYDWQHCDNMGFWEERYTFARKSGVFFFSCLVMPRTDHTSSAYTHRTHSIFTSTLIQSHEVLLMKQ